MSSVVVFKTSGLSSGLSPYQERIQPVVFASQLVQARIDSRPDADPAVLQLALGPVDLSRESLASAAMLSVERKPAPAYHIIEHGTEMLECDGVKTSAELRAARTRERSAQVVAVQDRTVGTNRINGFDRVSVTESRESIPNHDRAVGELLPRLELSRPNEAGRANSM